MARAAARAGRRPGGYALVYLGFAFVSHGWLRQFRALLAAYGVCCGLNEGVERALVTDFAAASNRDLWQYRADAPHVSH